MLRRELDDSLRVGLGDGVDRPDEGVAALLARRFERGLDIFAFANVKKLRLKPERLRRILSLHPLRRF